MRIGILALAVLLVCFNGAGQRKQKPPEVVVLEARAHRSEGKILVDFRVRVTAGKPLRGLVVVFDLMSPENGVVSSEKAVLDEATVEPGQERSSQSVTSDQGRAVRYKIRAFDLGERELRVTNAGPFPIE